ncbi:MAG: hypothetical protein ACJ749_20100 [Flavisolibacter sp.]
MLKILIAVVSLLILNSCKEKAVQQKIEAAPKNDTPKILQDNSSSDSIPAWVDSAIMRYINQTNNELIKMNRGDSTPIEWLFDRTEETDSATYLVFHLGHSFEYKYITDSWLYIDSSTRAIYEYDVAKDSLMRWSK